MKSAERAGLSTFVVDRNTPLLELRRNMYQVFPMALIARLPKDIFKIEGRSHGLLMQT